MKSGKYFRCLDQGRLCLPLHKSHIKGLEPEGHKSCFKIYRRVSTVNQRSNSINELIGDDYSEYARGTQLM